MSETQQTGPGGTTSWDGAVAGARTGAAAGASGDEFSWEKAAAAMFTAGLAGSAGGPVGALVGGLGALFGYAATSGGGTGTLNERSDNPVPPFAPYLDPVNPRVVYHHASAKVLNGHPMDLSCNALQLRAGTGQSGNIDDGGPMMQLLEAKATGAFRIGGQDCSVRLRPCRSVATWQPLVELWLDLMNVPESIRPGYDSIYFAQLHTPRAPFVTRTNQWVTLQDRQGIKGSLPIVLWIWMTGAQLFDQPPVPGSILVALEVPGGRPSGTTDSGARLEPDGTIIIPDGGGGVTGAGKQSGAGALLAGVGIPAALGAAGLALKLLR